MKLQALWFYYLKLNHATCEEKVGVVKSKMYKLFDEYVKVSSTSLSTSTSSQLVPLVEQNFNLEEIQGMEELDP